MPSVIVEISSKEEEQEDAVGVIFEFPNFRKYLIQQTRQKVINHCIKISHK